MHACDEMTGGNGPPEEVPVAVIPHGAPVLKDSLEDSQVLVNDHGAPLETAAAAGNIGFLFLLSSFWSL